MSAKVHYVLTVAGVLLATGMYPQKGHGQTSSATEQRACMPTRSSLQASAPNPTQVEAVNEKRMNELRVKNKEVAMLKKPSENRFAFFDCEKGVRVR